MNLAQFHSQSFKLPFRIVSWTVVHTVRSRSVMVISDQTAQAVRVQMRARSFARQWLEFLSVSFFWSYSLGCRLVGWSHRIKQRGTQATKDRHYGVEPAIWTALPSSYHELTAAINRDPLIQWQWAMGRESKAQHRKLGFAGHVPYRRCRRSNRAG